LCGNGTALEGYLDISLWLEYYGQVYLCVDKCALQVIEVLGGLIPSEAKAFLETTQKIADDFKELKEKYDAAIARLDVYDTAVMSAASAHLSNTYASRESEAGDEPDAAPNGKADSGESEPKESVTGGGPDDPKLFELRDERTIRL
jgi:hypothetical protein